MLLACDGRQAADLEKRCEALWAAGQDAQVAVVFKALDRIHHASEGRKRAAAFGKRSERKLRDKLPVYRVCDAFFSPGDATSLITSLGRLPKKLARARGAGAGRRASRTGRAGAAAAC